MYIPYDLQRIHAYTMMDDPGMRTFIPCTIPKVLVKSNKRAGQVWTEVGL